MVIKWLILLCVLFSYGISDAQVVPAPGVQLQDEGVAKGKVQTLNCVGTTIACTKSGVTGTVTVTGTTTTCATNYTLLGTSFCLYTGSSALTQALTIDGTCKTLTLSTVFSTPTNAVAIDTSALVTVTGSNVAGTFDSVSIVFYTDNTCATAQQDQMNVGIKEYTTIPNNAVASFSKKMLAKIFSDQVFYKATRGGGGVSTSATLYVVGYYQ